MNKAKLLVAGLLLTGSLLSSTPVKALCNSSKAALSLCYSECEKLFSVAALRDSCKLGCYIGCLWGGAS